MEMEPNLLKLDQWLFFKIVKTSETKVFRKSKNQSQDWTWGLKKKERIETKGSFWNKNMLRALKLQVPKQNLPWANGLPISWWYAYSDRLKKFVKISETKTFKNPKNQTQDWTEVLKKNNLQ